MLQPFTHLFENPDDVPEIPKASADYLHLRLNHFYLDRSGALDDLRRKGYSEQMILGFVMGCNAAVEVVEEMLEQRHKEEP